MLITHACRVTMGRTAKRTARHRNFGRYLAHFTPRGIHKKMQNTLDRVALELLGADALQDDETYDSVFIRELSHR